jgi:hypothetical protein
MTLLGKLLWRYVQSEKMLCMLNLVVFGVGVLLIPLGRMGWGFGRI